MNLRALRRRCEERLREIELPVPFDARLFCDSLAARRGRPIHLLAVPTTGGLTGACLALSDMDVIFYESNTSGWHQDHIILHETSHLLLDHKTDLAVDEESLRQLFPDFTPQMVRKVLQRNTYSGDDEREAELLASLILERAVRPRASRAPTQSMEPEDPVVRLEAILDHGGVSDRD